MILTRRLPFLLAIALTAGFLGACSATRPQPRPQASATPAPLAVDPSVDYRDPSAVCEAFAIAAHRIDTAVDQGPADAYQRTAAYLDATLAAAATVRDSVRQTPQWQEWALHGASTDVQIGPYAGDALPPDTAEQQHRTVLITSQPVGREGWRGPLERHTVVCTLRLTTVGWRISDYEIG
ncbi:hypothetical protein ACI2K4_29455 [Micromonospora sp. NPDC050397]|uniref:hypothetical protein n=1 Tax=Micromonospora sp. NPDC050397 TaxID=3364279 RepID=UPI00384DBD4F